MTRPVQPLQTGHRRAFTGWHMLAVMVAFFGVIVAVNLFMASRAVGSFSGTVVPNSYVASQHYNDWLAEGRRQAALGWTIDARRRSDGRVVLALRGADRALLDNASLQARAEHVLGQAPVQPLSFTRQAGRWISTAPLPAGRWVLVLRASHGGTHADFRQELR